MRGKDGEEDGGGEKIGEVCVCVCVLGGGGGGGDVTCTSNCAQSSLQLNQLSQPVSTNIGVVSHLIVIHSPFTL